MENEIVSIEREKRVYFTQYTNKFIEREDLNGMEKIIWLTLSNYSRQIGRCLLTMEYLSKKMGISKNTLRKHLDSLEKKGGLYICQRYNKTTFAQMSNRYYVIDINYQTGEFDKSLLEPLKITYPKKKIYE